MDAVYLQKYSTEQIATQVLQGETLEICELRPYGAILLLRI